MPETVLQNKLGGVNQRVLRTEALDFSAFDGCFPNYAGIQTRIYGKFFLQQFDAPVYGIYQFFPPIGRPIGIQQTTSEVSLSYWKLPDFSIPYTPPTTLSVSPTGAPESSGSAYNASGAFGGIAAPSNKIVSTTLNLDDYLLQSFGYQGVFPSANQTLQNCGGYPQDGIVPYCAPFGDPPYTFDLVPTDTGSQPFDHPGLSITGNAENILENNPSPPSNYLIQYIADGNINVNQTGNYDFSTLFTTYPGVVMVTGDVSSTINGVTTTSEVPLSVNKSSTTVIDPYQIFSVIPDNLQQWTVKTDTYDIYGNPLLKRRQISVSISFTGTLNVYYTKKTL